MVPCIEVAEAVKRLIAGEVVAIPTETVYGLAAALALPEAIERVFALKQRPANNPLITHVASAAHLRAFCESPPDGWKALTDAFWPGPLTLVLEVVSSRVPPIARAGLPTAAFRMPKHPIALEIVEQVGPLVAPSANRSGSPSATTPAHVLHDFGAEVPCVDGGPCRLGVESTVLVHPRDRWEVARLGAISQEELAAVLGYTPKLHTSESDIAAICPGRLHRHYAPRTRLILSDAPYTGDVSTVIGFTDRHYPQAKLVLPLGPSNDVESCLQQLYNTLRELDLRDISTAWVDMQIPQHGLWLTLAERLQRASS